MKVIRWSVELMQGVLHTDITILRIITQSPLARGMCNLA
jgi:hypothetical protein